ncbi:drebrin-like a isoform 1-T2 [Polymixia lowei]
MAVNLSKNGTELMAAYKDVVDTKSGTNWALFTYEGNSNNIRLAEKGEGGLEEMVEELSSGKVMYAFCQVQDPNSGLPKYVLVNWTGEGVKDSQKGLCANHVSAMANFLKGAHVTLNARAEEDVEPESILAKVAKASGANFHFHGEAQKYSHVPRGPVGSVYQKTNAVEEIQRTDKDNFWAQAQRDEEVRRKEESSRAEQERQKLERERQETDERQRAERETRAKERASQIEQDKRYQKQRETEERENEQQRREQQEKENTNSQRTGIHSAASVQKATEAKCLISQRSFNPRDLFKQREQGPGLNNGQSLATATPGKLQSPFLSQKRETPVEPQCPRPAAPLVPETPASPSVSASPTPLISPIRTGSPIRSDSPVTTPSPVVPQAPASPVQPADAAYAEEDFWSDDFDDDADDAILEEPTGQEKPSDSPLSPETEEDLYEDVYQVMPTVEEHGTEASGQGICARALYDYQAADDTEINFDPDDIITGIEMLDEGWWRGYGPDGHYGMFPANYVELL